MRDADSQCRITRVVDGDDHELQLAELQAVMQRIRAALQDIPVGQRTYVGNALLNLAVSRILGEGSSHCTATLLKHLSDALHAYPTLPGSSLGIDFGGLNG